MCANSDKPTFEIFLVDLKKFNFKLFQIVVQEPLLCITCFEFLVSKFINTLINYKFLENKKIKYIQIFFIETENMIDNNKIIDYEINRLIFLKLNIVIVGKVRTKIVKNTFKEKFYYQNSKIKNISEPIDNIFFSADGFYNNHFDFIDYQFVKGEKNFLESDSGGGLHSFTLLLEKNLVNKINIGNKYIISGICVFDNYFKKYEKKKKNFQNFISIKRPIIKVLGFYSIDYINTFPSKKELLFSSKNFFFFARSSSVYDWIYSMILPTIANRIDIKQAIACLLFGGHAKHFSSNYRFRGEINILFISDQLEFNIEILEFFKNFNKINFNLDFYSKFNNISNLPELRDYLSKKIPILNQKLLSNLSFFFIENFDYLNIQNKSKIIELIEDQTYYSKNEKNKIKESKRHSFIFFSSKKFFQNTLLKSIKGSLDFSFKIFSKFDLIFYLNSFSDNNNLNSKNELYYRNNLTQVFRKYVEFARNNLYPILSKNASELLIKIYNHLRSIQKKQKTNKLSFLTLINLNKLESIVRIAESLSKMRYSNLIDCNAILDAVRIIQKVITTTDILLKI